MGIRSTINANRGYLLPPPDLKKKDNLEKDVMSKNNITDVLRYMDYARAGGFGPDVLLKYELSKSPSFLEMKDKSGNYVFKKATKSDLQTELTNMIPTTEQVTKIIPEVDILVVDFMSILRKVPVKKKGLKTYNDLMKDALCMILSAAHIGLKRIDIIFDIYSENSIKQLERTRRAIQGQISVKISSGEQPLPVDMSLFWNSSMNKTTIQQFFFSWLCANYKGNHSFHCGGLENGLCMGFASGQIAHVPELFCNMKDEADDRIIMHLYDGDRKGYQSAMVISSDTDVFVSVLYHLGQSFTNIRKLYIKVGCTNRLKKIIPLHLIIPALPSELLKSLPAVHALTGCDSTSKVGTKTAIFKKSVSLDLIKGFGEGQCSEKMLLDAEVFLLHLLGQSFQTFNEY